MREISFRNDVLPLKDKLFRLALRITLDRQEAEDIVQDTLIKVWKLISDKGSEAHIDNIEAFSMTTCRNLSLDHKELGKRQSVSLDETLHDRSDISPTPDETVIRSEGENTLMGLMNALPEKQRTAMQLRDIEGKSYAEIATVMGITEADVKVNIFRARKKIKEKFIEVNQYGL